MARQARLALADMRAAQTQMMREEMHGGAFHGAGLVGGGGVPSMGLSQFRGGAMRGCGKNCRGCEMCCDDEESSSDEEMHGGSYLSSAAKLLGLAARSAAAARPGSVAAAQAAAAAARGATSGARSTALALRPAGSIVRYGVNNANASIASRLAYLNSPASRALTVRPAGAIKPYNPAEAAYRLGATAPARTIASRLAAAGITPARVAIALAAGVTLTGLLSHFGVFDGDYYDETPGAGPRGPGTGTGTGTGGTDEPPIGPDGVPIGPDGQPLPGMSAEEADFYLRTGNIPYRYLEGSLGRKRGGRKAISGLMSMQGTMSPNSFLGRLSRRTRGGNTETPEMIDVIRPATQTHRTRSKVMSPMEHHAPGKGYNQRPTDGRQARAKIVAAVMREKRLSLPMASKYVKDNGLY